MASRQLEDAIQNIFGEIILNIALFSKFSVELMEVGTCKPPSGEEICSALQLVIFAGIQVVFGNIISIRFFGIV